MEYNDKIVGQQIKLLQSSYIIIRQETPHHKLPIIYLFPLHLYKVLAANTCMLNRYKNWTSFIMLYKYGKARMWRAYA